MFGRLSDNYLAVFTVGSAKLSNFNYFGFRRAHNFDLVVIAANSLADFALGFRQLIIIRAAG